MIFSQKICNIKKKWTLDNNINLSPNCFSYKTYKKYEGVSNPYLIFIRDNLLYFSLCIIELNSLGFVIKAKANIGIIHIYLSISHSSKNIFISHYFFLGSIYNILILIMLTTKLLSDNRHRYVYICNLICI